MLTKITITVPDLGDNRKNLEVEGALAAGEKATVTLVGIPSGTTTDGTELRLRVLGPMGEDLATHGDWTVGADGEYTTDLDLATLQAYRLFVPPPPPPPPPNVRPVPRGYLPVRLPYVVGADVRLLVELRTDGDASMLGMRTRPLAYWPTDWKTATLIDLADGRVYSKEEVDELIAQEAQERANGDASTLASAKAYANMKYAKPAGGIPRSDLASDVRASLGKADTAIQQHQDISKKADLVGGKVPASQLPSYVDDVLEYDSRSDFPATGEAGKIYVAKDENKTYRWTGTQYVQVGGGDAPVLSVNGKTGDVTLNAADVGAATKADATLVDAASAWVFADGLLDAARENLSQYVHSPNHLELRQQGAEEYYSVILVPDDGTNEVDFAATELSSSGLSALMVGGTDWATVIVPVGGTVATRSSETGYQLGNQADKSLAKDADLQTHVANTTKHITAQERTAWNGKQNALTQTQLDNIAAVPNKAAQTALAAAFAAQAYSIGDLVTYNGLLYRCKYAYTATASSAKPDADTTHWEAAVVAVLLDGKLSTSGGAVNGNLSVSGVIQGSSDVIAPNGQLVVGTVGWDATNFYTSGIRTQGHGAPIQYPAYTGDGTDFFALLQHIAANFSISASYVVGQLVVYQGALYRCTNAHSAGAFDANDFTAATVEDALSAIRSSIPDISGKLDATQRNLLDYTSGTTLAPGTAIYRSSLNADGTFPTVDATAIPTTAAYYQFELELTVPSTVPSTITGPTGWTWLDGHGLPDPADLAGGETIYISVRLDCTARTFLASVWRVA